MRQIGVKVLQILVGRLPSPSHHLFDLIDSGGAWKHSLPVKHLAYEAAKSPHINLLVVIFGAKKKLRCTIPSGSNVVSHDNKLLLGWFFHKANQSKVTEFSLARFVNKYIARLNIPVNEVRMVKIEERLCDLVDDKLLVLLVKLRGLPILPNQSV